MTTQATASPWKPHGSHSYINVSSISQNGIVSPNLETAPPVGERTQRYVNVPLKLEPQEGKSSATNTNGAAAHDSVEREGSHSAGSASVTIPKGDGSLLHNRYHSDTSLSSPKSASHYDIPRTCGAGLSEHLVADAKLKFLGGEGGGGGGVLSPCKNCSELSRLLAMWEIGVSGLTRNYSKILSHLTKTRDAAMALDFRLQQNSTQDVSDPSHSTAPTPSTLQQPSSKIPKNRQSMFVNNGQAAMAVAGSREQDIAEIMYPNRVTMVPAAVGTESSPMSVSQLCSRDLNDLNVHLGEAIDLCQQLAAACFKKNHLSHRSSSHSLHHSSKSSSQNQRKLSAGTPPAGASYKPSLQSIDESRRSGKRRMLQRVPSAPNLEYSEEFTSSSESYSSSDNGFVKIQLKDVPGQVTKSTDPSNQKTTKVGVVESSALKNDSSDPSTEKDLSGKSEQEDAALSMSMELEPGMNYRPESILSSVSTYSDSDVKVVMSKIATLEEERYKLLETIDTLQEDNVTVSMSWFVWS